MSHATIPMIRVLKAKACALLLSVTAATSSEGKPPNILLILADDLGYGDLACYNPEAKVATPRMDRPAAEGMRFGARPWRGVKRDPTSISNTRSG